MSGVFLYRITTAVSCAAVLAVFPGCSSQGPVAGGSGSTTTNGFTATLVDSRGAPMPNAPIRIRPSDYHAGDSTFTSPQAATGTISDTTSGSDGTISITGLMPGKYTMEAFDAVSREGAVLRREVAEGPADSLGVVTAQPVGAIRGTLATDLRNPNAVYAVQVPGIERLIPVDLVTGEYLIPDLPPATYSLRIVSSDSTFTPVVIDTISVASNDTARALSDTAAAPYDGYAYTALLIINTTDAGLGENDTITNFPLLLRLNGENFDFSTAKRKGTDFRVAQHDTAAVPFEQEWWDSASATAALWILVDTLYGAMPDTLRLYWGNSRGGLTSQSEAIFDTAFSYTGVWHLNESGGQEQNDATVSGHSGIPHNMDGANDIPGLIGRAQLFEAKDSQSIIFSNMFDASSSDGQNEYAYTVSLWIKPASPATQLPQGLVFRDDIRTGIQLDSANRLLFTGPLQDNGADTCRTTITDGAWTHVCCVRKGPYHLLYANGVLVDSCFSLSRPGTDIEDNGTLRLGSLSDDNGWFDGTIDELRWSKKPRSPAWIKLCYETQRENEAAVTIVDIRPRSDR